MHLELVGWKFINPCSPEHNVTCLDSHMGYMWPQVSGTMMVVHEYKRGIDYAMGRN